MKHLRTYIPLALFLCLGFILWRGLSNDPHAFESPLIGKPVPVADQDVFKKLFTGHVSLLNVFASWCGACQSEQALLMAQAQTSPIPIYGLHYKDRPADAQRWLSENGNPFKYILDDPDGSLVMNLGVYGAPETFVIDGQGIIRDKYVGPLTESVWNTILQPAIERAQHPLAQELYFFSDDQQRTRFYKLTQQFRCLVCQNEDLASSHSALAEDLRQKIYTLITDQSTDTPVTDEYVIQYMRDRYGDFVLFQPRWKLQTLLLWLGPGAFLMIGLVFLYYVYKK